MNLQTAESRLESISGAIATLLIPVHLVGFLTVSIHDAAYGIAQFALLRSKILSAGISFALFFATASIKTSRVLGLFGFKPWTASLPGPDEPPRSNFYYVRLMRALDLYIVAVVLAFLAASLMVGNELTWMSLTIYIGFVAFATLVLSVAHSEFAVHPGKCALVAALTVTLGEVCQGSFFDKGRTYLVTWFFVTGL